ncbi:MAG: glutamate--tRNA ligase family protein [Proteobacteria bacterium]|nr:glutamate--tRNA ligase family protein [Pseudomonadota bacterium]
MPSRFAPSTTGQAHPGTLLAALLCWLDARSRGDRLLLRFEDLDPTRSQDIYLDQMRRDLEWFGLDWDQVVVQSDLADQHRNALDQLQAQGRLYPCRCTRSERRRSGRRSLDGGFAYANTCRDRPLPNGGWRAAREPVRLRLDDGPIRIIDESGADLSQNPAYDMGDPIVVRRDRAVAYHLAVVVDDGASQIDRIVRGRDLAPSTATQVVLQQLLGQSRPSYRHHLLFLEPRGDKLAKFHGAVGTAELRRHYRAAQLCGTIAWAAGLRDRDLPCRPGELLAEFSWHRVGTGDRVLVWRNDQLIVLS